MSTTTTPSSAPVPPKAKIDADSSPIPTTADKKKRAPRGKAPNRDVQVSKALSKLLRHDAEKHKLKLDEEGFAELDKVASLALPEAVPHDHGGRRREKKANKCIATSPNYQVPKSDNRRHPPLSSR